MVEIKIRAIEKLLEVVASGVGAVAGPLLLPYKAKMQAKVDKITAESEKRTIEIIAEAQAKARDILKPKNSNYSFQINTDLIQTKIQFQESKRLNNIANVISLTKENLPNKVSNKPVDHDWTSKFFQNIQDVSSQEMQQIWAQILAGEIKFPGQTSIRTMSVLSKLSFSEAKLFQQTLKYNIDGKIFYQEGSMPKKFINFNKISILFESGLIKPINNIAMLIKPNISKGKGVIGSYYGCDLFVDFPDQKTEIKIPVIMLSKAGIELSQFIKYQPDNEYLHCLSQFLKSRGKFQLKKTKTYKKNIKSISPPIVSYENTVSLSQQEFESLEIKAENTYYYVL